jgi:hypothetical protein
MYSNNAPEYNALLMEVLQPRDAPAPTPDLPVPDIQISPGSAADAVASKAANMIRYLAATYTKSIDPKRCPDEYQCGMAETAWETPQDAIQTVAMSDPVTAAAVKEVFRRAMLGLRVYPTTLRAQVEMQLCAIDAGHCIRGLLFKQQCLALN